MPHLLSAGELDRERIEALLGTAAEFRAGGGPRHPDALVGLAFFEESLRTRVGFDAAAARLRARTTTIDAAKHTAAMGSPESMADSVRSIAGWCDVLCLRHAEADAVASAAALTTTPVVNCGNGQDEHPTQALVDLFAIEVLRGAVDGLRIAMVGDLHAMRTTHSLALVLARFSAIAVRCIAPAGLELPERFARPLRDAGHELTQTTEMEVDDVDVLYVAGMPAPTRIGMLDTATQARYHVNLQVARRLRAGAHILSPLPRVHEIAPEVDALEPAAYFRQSTLGLGMRMAILDEALSGVRDAPRPGSAR